MCTLISGREVLVCDVSRDRVRAVLAQRLGSAARAETIDGEGTRFTCVEAGHIAEFQKSITEALDWDEGVFSTY